MNAAKTKGIARLSDAARRAKLQKWLRRDVAERFQGRIIAIDTAVATRWGALVGEAESRAVSLPVIDSLTAAASLVHDLTIVTRNADDFGRCGARCLNSWLPDARPKK